MVFSKQRAFFCHAVTLATIAAASPCKAAGRIDSSTLVEASHGTFSGVVYSRYEAMFEGTTPRGNNYRVPCQILAPADPREGSGLLLFDWLVQSTIFLPAVGQEQADARYTMTDEVLLGLGLSYATVRCDPAGIGAESPVVDPARPWSDDLLDTSSEHITSAGDEVDIVVDYVKALRVDPVAVGLLGKVKRTAAFGYSAAGYRLRGLLRSKLGKGLFDFSLVGGVGTGYYYPDGDEIGASSQERPPLQGAGLEIDFQSEADVLALDGHRARHEEPNYRLYQIPGASHLRSVDAVEFGLPDPESANPAEWTPFIRALFVAGNDWCDGKDPPPSLWLAGSNDSRITRDERGNALILRVGKKAVTTSAFRLPEVAVGENQYIPLDPSYNDGSFPGLLRMLSGSHVDLKDRFTCHERYVQQIAVHARFLQSLGYLLKVDADAIIQRAIASDIGNP